MMWIVRAGRDSRYYEKNISDERIYLPWSGYRFDLGKLANREDLKK